MSHITCRIADEQVDLRSLGTLLVNSGMIALAVIRYGRIVFASPAFHAMFDVSGPLAGITLAEIVTGTDDGDLGDALAIAERGTTRFTGLGHRGDEPVFDLALDLEPLDLGGESAVFAFASDVTEQYRSRERLTYLAFADALTGLPNRALFTDRPHQVILGARRHVMPFAVLMADLDGFKGVNDTFGHAAGDVVLREVAQRFRACIRETDTLARLGGDEFAVILPRTDDTQAAALVALRLIRTLEEPIDLGAQRVIVGTSIGIAVYPEHARSRDPLLRAADTALYRARLMRNRRQMRRRPGLPRIVSASARSTSSTSTSPA
jgi:diguanylate cyclase (GGDEF)-like protein